MDSISSIPTSKKQKLHNRPICCSDDNEDRISKLPDAILTHILSLLPAQDAERTGALSTRWKTLWALLPDLELVMPGKNLNLDSEDAFFNFAEKTLILRNGLPIRKFRLSCSNNTIDYDRVYDIICTAITCSVARLHLHFRKAMDKVRLPWTPLTNCKTLVELKLAEHFLLDVPMDVFFPSLKCLHLDSLIYFNDASLERLFSGCPVLEDLKVVRHMNYLSDSRTAQTDNVIRLNVSVPSLKRLEVVNVKADDSKHELLVDAPNLEHLDLYDKLSENYVVKNLPLIVEAILDVANPLRNWNQYAVLGDRVFGLLKSIFAVKTLLLSRYTMTTLGFADNKVLPTFHNLVRVSLGVDEIYGWLLLPSFLESMPNLEVLSFPMGLVPYRHWRADWRKDEPFKFNWYAPEAVPACLLMKLHTIEIRNDGPLMKKELKLIEYLLANAMCLKTMKICRSKMDEKTRNKLASYHRGSDSCRIILLKTWSAFWTRALI